MNTSMLSKIRDRLRASPWLLIGLLGVAWLVVFAPFKLGVLVWLGTKLCLAGYVGYWLDRVLFPYARPHEVDRERRVLASCRRALIVAGALVAAGLQA